MRPCSAYREGEREGGRGETVNIRQMDNGRNGEEGRSEGKEGWREGGKANLYSGEVLLCFEGLGGGVVLDVLLGVDT